MDNCTETATAYASRTVNKTEQKYSQIDKKALASVRGVRKFCLLLFGRHFTLVTDHELLISIFNPRKDVDVDVFKII